VRLLVLTHRLPWAPNRGDRIRAYYLLKALTSRHESHLLSLVHDDEEASHVADLSWLPSVAAVRVPRLGKWWRAGISLPTSTPLTFAMLDGPDLNEQLDRVVGSISPELVLAYCSGMARLLQLPLLSARPALIDMVDVDSAKWAALAGHSHGPMRWIYAREARLLARAEAAQMRQALATTVVNGREAEQARRIAPDADVHVVENGVAVEAFAPPGPPSADARVVFVGVMSYAPNADAAEWLGRRVWPRVRASIVNAELALVGTDPPASLRRLAEEDPSIQVTGHVSDVRSWLWKSAVAVAPIRTARGVQNKVLEAVAAGLPCVVSPAVFDGLPHDVRPACEVADDETLCATRLIELLTQSPTERRARATRASLSGLGWSQRMAPMLSLIEALEHSGFRRRHNPFSANSA
jgi:sugar transferase (PEP-CTERM/EpsH1 system associated)